ncbi:MAG TPA: hypothetical protein V6C85_39115 [Allocoleopsis sp.]
MKSIEELREEWVNTASHSIKQSLDFIQSAKLNPKLAKEYESLAKIHQKQAHESRVLLAKLSKLEKAVQKKLEG